MKKLIYFSILLLFSSCKPFLGGAVWNAGDKNDIETISVKTAHGFTITYEVYEVTHRNHSYMILNPGNSPMMIHDPDCLFCKELRKAEALDNYQNKK